MIFQTGENGEVCPGKPGKVYFIFESNILL